ncbi:MAG: 50S ribosomal protein L23 [Patescibacteria group bacterium]
MKYREIIKKPLLTEKTMRLAQEENKYTLLVGKEFSKGKIKEAVKDLYDVEVLGVKTLAVPHKRRRVWVLGGGTAVKSRGKKAIVELAGEDRIPGFEIGE